MSQDVMLCVMNSTAVFGDSMNLEMKKSESCSKCLDLEAELVKKKNMVERDAYTELSNRFARLEKHSQLQEKDTTINKLRNHIKSLRESDKKDRVKQDMDEIETINIELEHSVAKLLSENELFHKEIKHLKQIYKDQFDSIIKTRACSKEHNDSLIDQLNSKSVENADLKTQIQDKFFYILRGIVEQAKAKQPLDNALDFACKHAKRIQELLVYVRDTCSTANKPSEKLVAVTPMNKAKKVWFSKPLTSSSNIHKQVESSKTPDSNTPVLPSIGLKSSTSASRSQPTSNKKNDSVRTNNYFTSMDSIRK
ncbi:hypothetical protein Tco_0959556 [Tanacetum coccineum]